MSTYTSIVTAYASRRTPSKLGKTLIMHWHWIRGTLWLNPEPARWHLNDITRVRGTFDVFNPFGGIVTVEIGMASR